MECELAAAGPAGRTAWPGSEEDSGCSWKKKGTCQMKSLMSRWKDAVSDFTLTKKKKPKKIETENTQSEASATAAGGRCFLRHCFTECELTAACDSNISCCI